MSYELNSLDALVMKDVQRSKLYTKALDALAKLKDVVDKEIQPANSPVVDEGYLVRFSNAMEGVMTAENKESYKAFNDSVVLSILKQKNLETLLERANAHFVEEDESKTEVTLLKEVIAQRTDEIKLINDLAVFTLNNSDEFVAFCTELITGELKDTSYSKEFIQELKSFYFRSDNFTNTFLSFYMSYFNTIKFVIDTDILTENFKGDTNLVSVRQSNVFSVDNGVVNGDFTIPYIVFSADLKDCVDKVMEYLVEGDKYFYNPFKVKIGELMYYRDLTNTFRTFSYFGKLVTKQFIENILNKTSSTYVGLDGTRAYFAVKTNDIECLPKKLDFKIYGISFTQRLEIEKAGATTQ